VPFTRLLPVSNLSHTIDANNLEFCTRITLLCTNIHEFSGQYLSLFSDPPLQCPELPVGKASRLFLLEAFKQFLGRYIRAFLQPPENLSPNRFKRVFSRSPMPGIGSGTAMGGPHLSGPP
jgi:hypothetical protein